MLPDDQARGEGLDGHDASLGVEVDGGDLRLLGDDAPDGLLRLLLPREEGGVGADGHPTAQALGQLPDEIGVVRELVHVLRVDDHEWSFEVDLRNLDAGGNHLGDDFLRVSNDILDAHSVHASLLWKVTGGIR